MFKFRLLTATKDPSRPPTTAALLAASLAFLQATFLPSSAQPTSTSDTATVQVLHSFQPPTALGDFRFPYAPLLWIPERQSFFGVADQGPSTSTRGGVFQWSGDTATPQILHEFVPPEFRQARHPLILDSEGYLQGTATAGGLASGAFGGVFRIRPDGSGYEQTHVFTGGDQGATPSGPVIEGTDGLLYGVTDRGGSAGNGTVYRMQKDGTGFQILRHFLTHISNPAKPAYSLAPGASNEWIGVSFAGGSANAGTVYSLSYDGRTLQVLHSFLGNPMDGKSPSGPLLRHEGWLWGVTLAGGSSNLGTIYRLKPDGSAYQTVHSFTGRTEGESPYGHLCLARDGFLYGTTSAGGGQSAGTFYRIHPTSLEVQTVLRLQRIREHPQIPQAGLIQTQNGSLFGTSTGGGDFGFGTLFQFRPPVAFEIIPAGPQWILQWIDNGLEYQAESKTSLHPDETWEPYPGFSELNGSTRSLRIPAPTSTLFIRLNTPTDP